MHFGWLIALLTPALAQAQAVNLTEAPLEGRCVRNEISMQLDGKITFKQDGKDLVFPHKAQARHVYLERFLDAPGPVAAKGARHYLTAEGTIVFNNNESSKRSLRDARRFMVAQRMNGHIVSFSPKGPLTREEVELTEHFDTMAVAGLLPGKEIEIGKSWPIANASVLALCELDGVTKHTLQGTLDFVTDGRAKGKIAGSASGINLGAAVEMDIDASFEFDIKLQRIVAVNWKESDKRQQGPITPALTAEVTIQLTRTPIAEPEELNRFALLKVPDQATPPAELTNIRHQDARNRFELSHPRDWHVTSPENSPQLVLRLIERGDFIAQMTITPWKKIDPKDVMSLEKFAEEMNKTPGWVAEKETSREKLKDTAKGHQTVYRVAASGELEGQRTVQYFYLIVSPQGDQMLVAFSVVPQHVQRLGTRDVEMVREIILP
jgi:hypothetical protein